MVAKRLTECVPHRVNHYLSLVVAENPLEAHREYKRRTQVRGFAAPVHVTCTCGFTISFYAHYDLLD